MKRLLPLLLILNLTGIALFGAMLFDMSPGHSGGCIASSIDGTACPTNMNDFGMHHISALETFTRAITPNESGWLLAFAFLLISAISVFLLFAKIFLPKIHYLPQRLRELQSASLCSQQKVASWLSLFELSPAII